MVRSIAGSIPRSFFLECDVLVVGAGIVGLAHAAEAADRGLSVVVIDRDTRAVGASVRNFGHCCVTAQSGDLLELAHVARERWLQLSERAGFFSIECGALAVARSEHELAVLEELSVLRGSGEVRMLTPAGARQALTGSPDAPGFDPSLLGGAALRDDLRVDPREAVGAIAAWLGGRPGVQFVWQTSYLGGAGDGVAHTSRGDIRATRTIVCVGHDLDYLFPQLAAEHEIERCGLQMMRIDHPAGFAIRPAVLTGTSTLRYPAFAETDAATALRAELSATDPELIDIGANVMFTQQLNGTLIVGDSHSYATTMDPFLVEQTSRVLCDRVASVLGVDTLRVLERWQGVYASSPQHPYLVAKPAPGVTAVSITSGVGMTISLGLAHRVVEAFA